MQLGSNLGSLWDRFGIMFRGCWDKLSHHLNLNDYAPLSPAPTARLAELARLGWGAALGGAWQSGLAGLGQAGPGVPAWSGWAGPSWAALDCTGACWSGLGQKSSPGER